MRIEQAILDAGPLIAVLSRHDDHHAWAAETLTDLRLPVVTCEAVLSEVWFQIRRSPSAQRAFAEMIEEGFFRVAPIGDTASVAKYALRFGVDFADACLVSLSKTFPRATVITTDRRDFTVLRRFGKEPVPFVAPEL